MLRSRGRPVPEELTPEAPEAGAIYWRAFHVLSRSRHYTGGMISMPLAIAWHELDRYCERYGLDLREAEDIVGAMDDVFLRHEWDRRKRAVQKPRRAKEGQEAQPEGED